MTSSSQSSRYASHPPPLPRTPSSARTPTTRSPNVGSSSPNNSNYNNRPRGASTSHRRSLSLASVSLRSPNPQMQQSQQQQQSFQQQQQTMAGGRGGEVGLDIEVMDDGGDDDEMEMREKGTMPPKVVIGGVVDEEQVLPENNMPVVFTGLMLVVFLAALDQTIVSTAVPSMIRELDGHSLYSWVGTSYLLAASSFSPVYGKLSDIIGRKPVIYFAIFTFLTSSLFCGASQSMLSLVIFRAFQGIGGGGCMQMVQITISDIVSLEERSKFTGSIAAVWGVASVVGPLIGGFLTDYFSWRWCFLMNLPSGGVATFIIYRYLNVNPPKKTSWQEQFKQFDFLGLAMIMIGVVSLLLGLQKGSQSWSDIEAVICVAFGTIALIVAAVYECNTSRSPIVPPRLFKSKTPAAILVSVFIHSAQFYAASYFMPLYFQILGASATGSGVEQMPFTFASSIVSVMTGFVVTWLGDYRWVSWTCWAFVNLGLLNMSQLDESSGGAAKFFSLLVFGLGVGPLFLTPLTALHASMPVKDMATSTATFGLIRMLGGTLGICVGGSIFATQRRIRVGGVENYHPEDGEDNVDNLEALKAIEPPELRQQVLHAYSTSVSTIWTIYLPFALLGFGVVLLYKKYPLRRPTRPAKTPNTRDYRPVPALDNNDDNEKSHKVDMIFDLGEDEDGDNEGDEVTIKAWDDDQEDMVPSSATATDSQAQTSRGARGESHRKRASLSVMPK